MIWYMTWFKVRFLNLKMSNKDQSIFVAGHNGLVGSAICRVLKKKKFKNIITVNRKKLDLTDQKKVFNFLKKINLNT